MRRRSYIFSHLAFIILFLIPCLSHPLNLTLDNAPTQVYFSPHGECTAAIINQIDRARSEILVQAFSFTPVPIAKALINAHKRGVKVQAILDKSRKSVEYTSFRILGPHGLKDPMAYLCKVNLSFHHDQTDRKAPNT